MFLLNEKSFYKNLNNPKKSIGKIDNQMSSGMELELGAINRPKWLLHPILFPQVYVN